MDTRDKRAKLFLQGLYLLVAGMLLYAPFHEGGYWFYQNLRLFVFVVCGILCLVTATAQDDYYANPGSLYPYLFGVVALLFNPLIPVHLDRDIWFFIDLGAGGFMVFYFIERKVYHRRNGAQREN